MTHDVLVIGKNTLNIRNTVSLLQRAGYDILTMANARDAFRFLEVQPVRLVLIDPVASHQDGYEICRRLQYKFDAEVMHIPAADQTTFQTQSYEPGSGYELGAARFLAQVRAVMQRPARIQNSHLSQAAGDTLAGANWSIQPNQTLPSFWRKVVRIILDLHPLTVAWLYLGVLSITEILTAAGNPRSGLMLYGLWLMLLILHSALKWECPLHRFLLSLALVPLIRITSLSLPLAGLPLPLWYLLITLPLLATVAMMAPTLQFSWREIGLNRQFLPVQVLVGSTGLVLGYLGSQILKSAPLFTPSTWMEFWASAFVLLICTGLTEELIFRGIIQRAAVESLGGFGMVYAAVLHTMLHAGHQSPLLILFVFGVNLFFGWVVARTHNILGVTICHGLINIIIFVGMPVYG